MGWFIPLFFHCFFHVYFSFAALVPWAGLSHGIFKAGKQQQFLFSKMWGQLRAPAFPVLRTSVQQWLKSWISNGFGVFEPHTKAGMLSFERFGVWLESQTAKDKDAGAGSEFRVWMVTAWVTLFVPHGTWESKKWIIRGKEYSSMGKKKKCRCFWQNCTFDISVSALYEIFPLSLEFGWSSELGAPVLVCFLKNPYCF